MIGYGSVRLWAHSVILAAAAIGLAAGCAAPAEAPTPTPTLPPTRTPTPPPPELPYAAELQAALDQALQKGQGSHTLGISAAVIAPGYQPWVGVTGDSQPGVPVHADMLFNVGSVAKTYEAALALKLAEQGRFDLDARISTWLPAHRYLDERITVRQLLNHTSGVSNVFEHPDFPWVGPEVDYSRAWQLEEVLDDFVGEPYARPGIAQQYSSTNYLLLTAILEEVVGDPVPDQVRRALLDPLDLDHTWISMGELPPRKYSVAHPWADVDLDGDLDDLGGLPQTWVATLTHPAVYATPLDAARWMQALFEERRVLSERSLKEMLSIPRGIRPDPEGGSYGLGIVDFSKLLGVNAVGHGGSSLGYSAAALYLPDSHVSLAWCINTGEGPRTLADRLMQETWIQLSQAVLEQLAPEGSLGMDDAGAPAGISGTSPTTVP